MNKGIYFYIRSIAALILVLGICHPAKAFANCVNPAASIGTLVYNGDENVPQVCVDIGWVALGRLNPGAGGGGCTDPEGTEGTIVYNGDLHVPQYCDGENWRAMIGFVNAPAAPGGLTGPEDCPEIGDLCADGTVFAGYHPTFHEWLFLHPNNQSSAALWSSESVNNTGSRDIHDGMANQQWIVANRTITNYPAFKLCDDLNAGSALGHNDWFLPSSGEMHYFRLVRDQINAGPGSNFISTRYWTSTERDNSTAWEQDFDDTEQTKWAKSNTYDVRCARRG